MHLFQNSEMIEVVHIVQLGIFSFLRRLFLACVIETNLLIFVLTSFLNTFRNHSMSLSLSGSSFFMLSISSNSPTVFISVTNVEAVPRVPNNFD